MSPALFGLIVASVTLNALAQVTLRKAMLVGGSLPPLSEPARLAFALLGNPWLWGGMACYAVSILLWLVVLGRAEVSVAYPMLSIGYVIAAVLGVVYLGEVVTLARGGGIALICLGVLVLSRTA